MPELTRHIPVIALTIMLTVSLIYFYRNLTMINERLENFSQEFYYGMNSVNEITSTIQNKRRESPQSLYDDVCPTNSSEMINNDTRLSEENDIGGLDEVRSADSDDVMITSISSSPENYSKSSKDTKKGVSQSKQKKNRDTAPKELLSQNQADTPTKLGTSQSLPDSVPDVSKDVDAYIENLQEKFGDSLPNSSRPADEDATSIDSEVSTVNQLNGRKKVPPYPAKNFPEGHTENWNGNIYPVIVTKTGSKRWGGKLAAD